MRTEVQYSNLIACSCSCQPWFLEIATIHLSYVCDMWLGTAAVEISTCSFECVLCFVNRIMRGSEMMFVMFWAKIWGAEKGNDLYLKWARYKSVKTRIVLGFCLACCWWISEELRPVLLWLYVMAVGSLEYKNLRTAICGACKSKWFVLGSCKDVVCILDFSYQVWCFTLENSSQGYFNFFLRWINSLRCSARPEDRVKHCKCYEGRSMRIEMMAFDEVKMLL